MLKELEDVVEEEVMLGMPLGNSLQPYLSKGKLVTTKIPADLLAELKSEPKPKLSESQTGLEM